MKTTLFSIVNFVEVEAGATAQLPHGLNINDGTPVIPDEIKRRSTGTFFDITVDDTYISVENKGSETSDVDVLCEHWHSIERQLGTTDYGVSSLPIQPWESTGGGNLAVPGWSTGLAVAADVLGLPQPGYVMAVEATIGAAVGPKQQVQNGAPAAGEVNVSFDANGVATLTFNAADAITEAAVTWMPLGLVQ
jgi:hypothetical protein